MGGLEILVNLLETRDLKCQNGSLSVLLQIVTSTEMRRYLIDLGIVTPLIQMLKHPARDIQVSLSFVQYAFLHLTDCLFAWEPFPIKVLEKHQIERRNVFVLRQIFLLPIFANVYIDFMILVIVHNLFSVKLTRNSIKTNKIQRFNFSAA